MSAQALQRVVVRMLHDPDLARATAGADLSASERGWIEAVDPRRWRADAMRRYRVLHALIDEYPVSAAQIVRGAGVACFDRFFEGPWFHRTVQARGVLALAFGAWLQSRPEAAPFAGIERAIAQVRRAACVRHRVDRAARWKAAPWIAWGDGPVAAWAALHARLAAHPDGPIAAALDSTLPLSRALGASTAWLVDGSAEPRVEEPPEALTAFLEAARRPLDWAQACAALIAAGAEPAEADALLVGFIDDALLTRSAD